MALDKAIYDKALAAIAERREAAEAERKKRRDICIMRFPRIAECEAEMRNTALSAAKAIGMGEKADEFIKKLAEKNLSAQAEIRSILKNADLPEDYLQIHYRCEKCNDTGFVDGRMCDCFKSLVRTVSYKSMCGKFPLESSTFENFDLSYYPDAPDEGGVDPRSKMSSIYEYCKSYADDFSRRSESLIMMGETGLGKTHMSLAIAGRVIGKGFGVIYGSAQNLLNSLEDEKFGRAETTGGEKAMLECDLLIIDDLGVEFSTQFTVSAVYNIINSRMMSGKPTVISTNLSLKEIEARYTRRIASRIMGGYTVLTFRGSDVRPMKAL